jgi:hypothetical protein
VLFPADMPTRRTGPGAIVWSDSASCPGGAGVRVAPLAAVSEMPSGPQLPHDTNGHALGLRSPLGIATAPHGQIAIVGRGSIVQGKASGPFKTLTAKAPIEAPVALASAYLGDLALALAPRGGAPLVQVERFFSNLLGAPRLARLGARGPVSELAVALDYRSDALAVWAQGDSVYAQDLPASGVRHPVQRIGPAGANVRLAALLSDDNRGMVVWEDRSGGQTSVHFDYSGAGVRFGAAKLLERFGDAPPTAPRLIRLSTESVMLAWAGAQNGRQVIRTAAVDQHGIGAPGTIAASDGDALLEDLVPGPRGEALLLIAEPQPPGIPGEAAPRTLLAARGVDASPDRTIFAAPEPIAPPGPVSEASLGVDPDTDVAVAAWRAGGGTIEYSVRAAG